MRKKLLKKNSFNRKTTNNYNKTDTLLFHSTQTHCNKLTVKGFLPPPPN